MRKTHFVDITGAAKLLGVDRSTVRRYYKSERLRGIPYGVHTLIPLSDIADMLDVTQRKLLRDADDLGIPVWISRIR